MAKLEKLLDKLLKEPPPTDFTWSELVTLLTGLGYVEKNGSGSRIKFYKNENGVAIPIYLHKPHPQNEIKRIYIKKTIIPALKANGDLK